MDRTHNDFHQVERRNGLATRPLREYYSRVLAYLICSATIAAGTYIQYFSMDLLWMVPYALLYPHRLSPELPLQARSSGTHGTGPALLDAMNAGAGILLLGFHRAQPDVPADPQLQRPVSGSLRNLAMALLCVGIGIGLAYPVVSLHYRGVTPPLVSLVSILFTTFYVCATAYFVHQQGVRLARRARKSNWNRPRPRAWPATGQVSVATGLGIDLHRQAQRSPETQRKRLTVFFSDIKGFTELSEELEAEALTDLLNNYLNEMSKIALSTAAPSTSSSATA